MSKSFLLHLTDIPSDIEPGDSLVMDNKDYRILSIGEDDVWVCSEKVYADMLMRMLDDDDETHVLH